MKCLLCKTEIEKKEIAGEILVGSIDHERFQQNTKFPVHGCIHLNCIYTAIRSIGKTVDGNKPLYLFQ